MTEAVVAINGTLLSIGQVMSIRMACMDFLVHMSDDDALGDDDHGRRMVQAYRARIREVIEMMLEGL